MTWTAEHRRRWNERHPDRVRVYNRAYYQKNRERHMRQCRGWKLANPDKVRACQQRWYYSDKGQAYLQRTREHREKQRLRRWALHPERYIEASRRWYHSEVGQRYMAEYRKKNKDKMRLHNRAWTAKNLHKVRTYYLVRRALRDGLIVKGPCAVCGTTEKVEASHNNYKKPLDITWLCRTHRTAKARRMPSLVERARAFAKSI